jgi:hypothetical protein
MDETVSFEYPIPITPDLFDYGFNVIATTGTFYELYLQGQAKTILDFINDPANADSAAAREFVENNWSVVFDLNINERGERQNYRIVEEDSEYNKRALKLGLDFLQSAPPFDVASYKSEIRHDWDYTLGIRGTTLINWDRFKEKFRDQYSLYKDKAIQQMDQKALDYYMFGATRMGWINCDVFWYMDGKKKTDFKVSAPKDTKIQLIFKDIKSIMSGTYKDGKFIFNGVPLGSEIKIIGIGYSNGKPTMTVAETVVDVDGFELAAFKEFSLEELETELNKLD